MQQTPDAFLTMWKVARRKTDGATLTPAVLDEAIYHTENLKAENTDLRWQLAGWRFAAVGMLIACAILLYSK
jgi:hypothetical protein